MNIVILILLIIALVLAVVEILRNVRVPNLLAWAAALIAVALLLWRLT